VTLGCCGRGQTRILLWCPCTGASPASGSANDTCNQDRSRFSDLAYRDPPPPCDKDKDPIVAVAPFAEAPLRNGGASDDLFLTPSGMAGLCAFETFERHLESTLTRHSGSPRPAPQKGSNPAVSWLQSAAPTKTSSLVEKSYCRLNLMVIPAWKLPPGGGGAWTAAIIAWTSLSIASLPEDRVIA
jgi:hypothetical protein